MVPFPQSFSTSLGDRIFSGLFCDQLASVPITFFDHVRSSIRILINSPPQNATQRFPRFHIISDDPDENRTWLTRLLQWNDHWGYLHWHRISYNSSGINVSPSSLVFVHTHTSANKIGFFDDPCTQDIIMHALRMSDSAGWFSVYVPQEYRIDPLFVKTAVPINIATISFVLAAVGT